MPQKVIASNKKISHFFSSFILMSIPQRTRNGNMIWIEERKSLLRTIGLDLSQHGLDRDVWSRKFKKWHLDRPKVSTVQKNDILTSLSMVYALKSWFVPIFNTVSISTFSKPCPDESRNLDLDWSRLSRPPGLKTSLKDNFKRREWPQQ
jgi:hypothetical protein